MKYMLLIAAFVGIGGGTKQEVIGTGVSTGSILSSRLEYVSAAGQVRLCCGGPICLPNEPCPAGGGGQ
jgi:hypothetical protein